MSKPLTEEERRRLREEALRTHNEEMARRNATGGKTGLSARWATWQNGKIEATKKNHPALARTAAALTSTVGVPLAGLGKFTKWAVPRMVTRKEQDGHRHFAPVRTGLWIAAIGLSLAFRTYLAMGAYYYGTFRTYKNVYVPNAGVFINQQFEHPNQAGRINTPRDEIHTVLGKSLDQNGNLEPFRADIDSNMYFFWKRSAWRPDLLSAEITPQSQFGADCTFETTGGTFILPRALRGIAKNWIGAKMEIVDGYCRQLKEVPSQYIQIDAPEWKQKNSLPSGSAAKPTVARPEGSNAETTKQEPKKLDTPAPPLPSRPQ